RFQQAPYRIADVVALLFIAHGNTSFGSLAPIIPYRSCKHYLSSGPLVRSMSTTAFKAVQGLFENQKSCISSIFKQP
ncbi:hypothetical protein, partial [Ruthenibacterium lactatiformans]